MTTCVELQTLGNTSSLLFSFLEEQAKWLAWRDCDAATGRCYDTAMSTAPRSFFRVRYRTIILLMFVAIILWSGFSYWTEFSENAARRARDLLAPPVGVFCRIELEAADKSVIRGEIIEQSERWIVVQPSRNPETPNTSTNPVWIPRERVLFIEVSK